MKTRGSSATRGLMLDSALTMLALRGLREPTGHYPFMEGFRERRTRVDAARGRARWRQVLDGLSFLRGSRLTGGAVEPLREPGPARLRRT